MPHRRVRYNFILGLTALATALAGFGGWRYARASAPVNGPIILISIDTLRADHLPAYGYRQGATPAIDALAADGIVFERAYAHATQTLPAHVAILSGRLPFDTGVRDDFDVARGSQSSDSARSLQAGESAVKPAERLLPQLLRERGYTTAAIVSTTRLRKETGINRGFDFFDDRVAGPSEKSAIDSTERAGADSEQIAEHWLETAGTSRVFLFLQLNEPHAPYAPPERFAALPPYDGEIAAADEIVGRLTQYLKAHQLYDRSTIVLLSDHGEGLGDHGEREHGLFVYEEAIHVPLIVKPAAGEGAGRRVADLVQHVDLVPTILDLVKAPLAGSLRGRSLKPLLEGSGHPAAPLVYSEALYGQDHFGWAPLTSLVDGQYQYIGAPRPELYDLRRDPRERQNLAAVASNESVVASSLNRTTEASTAAEAHRTLARALDRLVPRIVSEKPAHAPSKPASPAKTAMILSERARSAPTRSPLWALPGRAPRAEPADDAVAPADPKDVVETLERYRAAVDLARERRFGQAIALLQRITHKDDGLAEAWERLAEYSMRVERFDQAAEFYARVRALRPADPHTALAAATAQLRLRRVDEAGDSATTALHLAPNGARVAAAAHTLLARIALNRHDADEAHREAALAQQADRALPITAFVDARLLYDQGKYEDALPFFEEAAAAVVKAGTASFPDLRFYTAETLARLDRHVDAEPHYLEEIRQFPPNTRAHVALVAAYQAMGRAEDAGLAIEAMIDLTPTPESYALASRLWRSLGNHRRADAVRAEGRKAFAEPTRATADGSPHRTQR